MLVQLFSHIFNVKLSDNILAGHMMMMIIITSEEKVLMKILVDMYN